MTLENDRKGTQVVLPKWLWIWLPPVILLIVFPAKMYWSAATYDRWINSELGIVELVTPLFAFIGFIFGLKMLRLLRGIPGIHVRIWVMLMTLSCFYLAGEEISWGQQLFSWQTPEAIDKINDQHETNLHNMSSWFDQKPRMLLEIWVAIGGILVPVRQLSGSVRPAKGSAKDYFWPTVEVLPTAVLAILIRLPPRLKVLMGMHALPLEIRWSEIQEYYFALFLMLYLMSIYRRLLAAAPPST